MALGPGIRLGAYEISAQIGAGGMGEVYRARDTKLNRDVALKVLPELFALDSDRLSRFKREAQLLASLNHPNVATIYGLEESNGVQALVLELVDGQTLADHIATGPFPIKVALPIAGQIAEALEAAHGKDIVHRDLKPANIKITPEGVVKVLDFGLAKAVTSDAAADLSQVPTITQGRTQAGIMLGTPAYMSPEQTRGQRVDKRTDIWAFGCVLYEMLAGQGPFLRETMPDTIAAVLEGEPNWAALPAATPTRIRRLLQRCLEKDPKRRPRDIGDLRLEIVSEDPQPAGEAAASMRRAVPRWDWATLPLARADSAGGKRLLAVLSLIVLVVTVLVVAMQYRQGEQEEDLRQAAEEVFYNLRALEGNLVRLRRLDPLSSDLREATYRRDKLTHAYDNYIERLGLYDGKSQTEMAVLRMARRLGEVDINVPADFHTLTMTYVQRWSTTDRLRAAIARARERNLIQRIRTALDEKGLPRELLFLVLQESDFDTSLVGPRTRTGVPKGLWQFMPEVAKRYGLTIGPLSSEPVFDSADERHDEDRSTAAAINYLADIYSTKAEASALLVIASYNVGENAVLRKLEELPSDPRDRNFWNFYRNQWLSEEARDYVMAIFSAALICEQPELFHAPFKKIW